jgi:general secretion pathway protein D
MVFSRGLSPALVVSLFLIAITCPLSAQFIESMEFQDKPITDILLALAEISGKSIIPDETVRGRASYYFSKVDFDTALKVFLSTYNLYLTVEDEIYYVSRIRSSYNPYVKTVVLDAEDVEIVPILHALSKTMGKTILYDVLPPERITLHAREISPENLLLLIVKRLKGFTLESTEDYFYIKKIPEVREVRREEQREQNVITRSDNLFSIVQAGRPLFELLDELFHKAGREYSLITRKNEVIELIRYRDKSFDQLLRLILDQVNMDFQVLDEIYYIFEISQKNVLNKLRSTVTVPILHTTPDEIMKLFPPDMLASRIVKADPVANTILLTGTPEEISPIRAFIRKVDRPIEGSRYHRFDLSFIKAENMKGLLPAPVRNADFIIIPGTNSFAILLSEPKRELVEQYLSLVDRSTEVSEIHLKFIKAKDLTEHLPPSVAKEDIIETGDPSVVFFRGSKEKQEVFRRELAVLDQPVPQIQYQLLVVQFSEGSSLNWQNQEDTLISFDYPEFGSHAYSGNIGYLLDLNFDVFSTLGAKLSMDLNLALSENEATVLTDTTLSSLSGQTVKFQDTETFRYQELEVVDGETRETGVTREVSTGLIVSIQGWASGDGMITMEVDATVSKRGVDTTGTLGSLPPTTEKKVTTQVRTVAGKPVILSGLFRSDMTTVVDKIPILGDIPILGLLFQKKIETETKSEVVIFVMPHIETVETEELDSEKRIAGLYQNLFRPAVMRR